MFMLRCVIFSLFFALLSTCLVRPDFWKSKKTSSLFNGNCTFIGISYTSVTLFILTEILCFACTLFISMTLFWNLCFGYNFFSYLPLFMVTSTIQTFKNFNYKKHYEAILYIALIIYILVLQELYVTTISDKMPIPKPDNSSVAINCDDQAIHVIPSLSEKNNNYETEYFFSNGKHIIYNEPFSSLGCSLLILDNNYEGQFLPLPYTFEVSRSLRAKYLHPVIRSLYICLDGDTPYGVFATYKKTWLLGNYNISKYILLNLLDGTLTEYEDAEHLPDFAR